MSLNLMQKLQEDAAGNVQGQVGDKVAGQKEAGQSAIDKALHQEEQKDVGANGYLYVQVVAVGHRVYFLSEAYSTEREAGYPRSRFKFLESFQFLE
jgi:hypothetical protein